MRVRRDHAAARCRPVAGIDRPQRWDYLFSVYRVVVVEVADVSEDELAAAASIGGVYAVVVGTLANSWLRGCGVRPAAE
ncbi:hypothetical protein [Fimbriiglobus ruber]|uniref:hypothetical protein n=1 Tax=Fimbriiglobus ruber TaxID=1908690 RepID=UPI00117A4F04|nr:hypothetical protein [Fimbriiglobus ruber]